MNIKRRQSEREEVNQQKEERGQTEREEVNKQKEEGDKQRGRR